MSNQSKTNLERQCLRTWDPQLYFFLKYPTPPGCKSVTPFAGGSQVRFSPSPSYFLPINYLMKKLSYCLFIFLLLGSDLKFNFWGKTHDAHDFRCTHRYLCEQWYLEEVNSCNPGLLNLFGSIMEILFNYSFFNQTLVQVVRREAKMQQYYTDDV